MQKIDLQENFVENCKNTCRSPDMLLRRI